jgi:hypothetical protein
MNGDKTRSVVGTVRAMTLGRAFPIGPQTKATLERGKGYMAALKKLRPGEEVFLTGALQVHQLAHRIFGKGNYRTRRTETGVYVAYTPPRDVERCPTCGAVEGSDAVVRTARTDSHPQPPESKK